MPDVIQEIFYGLMVLAVFAFPAYYSIYKYDKEHGPKQ